MAFETSCLVYLLYGMEEITKEDILWRQLPTSK